MEEDEKKRKVRKIDGECIEEEVKMKKKGWEKKRKCGKEDWNDEEVIEERVEEERKWEWEKWWNDGEEKRKEIIEK